MKLLKFFLTAIALIAFNTIQAQAETSATVVLPDWGVADENNATYYYIPGAETYYDIRNKKFVYMQDKLWMKSDAMPPAYSDYDLYTAYKVVLTDNEEPFGDFKTLKVKYPKNYKGKRQETIKPKKD